jgi:hypothetical protein
MLDCVYREEADSDVLICYKFGKCKLSDGNADIPGCDKCTDRLKLDQSNFLSKWEDPLHIVDRRKAKTDGIRDHLAGNPAFLIGGGPSANDLPLEMLNERGIFSMAINNVAAHPRFIPQAFVCSDPPLKFSHSIWCDPKIMKIAPFPKLSGRRRASLRWKVNGEFKKLDKKTYQCPNVWGFKRYSHLYPDDRFFLSDGACWGNHRAGMKRTGEHKTVCTMLLGMRLMRYLGCSRLYLVGVDFYMQTGYGYSFNQARTQGACDSNNRQFTVVTEWCSRMQQAGVFERFGMPVFNCFQKSGLRAFPYVPFEEAVEDVRGLVEKGTIDTFDFYTKGQENKGDKK